MLSVLLLLFKSNFTWWSNCMSMYFPNRLELSFFRVLAFPKAWRYKELRFNILLHDTVLHFEHVHSEYTKVFNGSFQTKSLNSDLQHRIRKKEPISHIVQDSSAGTAHCIKLQDFLRGLRLASTTFTRDENEVVVGFTNHCPVNIVSKCKAERSEK